MIELLLKLRAIQSNFKIYKWTMAIQSSFEYWEDHKSEKEYKAIAVEAANWQKL